MDPMNAYKERIYETSVHILCTIILTRGYFTVHGAFVINNVGVHSVRLLLFVINGRRWLGS